MQKSVIRVLVAFLKYWKSFGSSSWCKGSTWFRWIKTRTIIFKFWNIFLALEILSTTFEKKYRILWTFVFHRFSPLDLKSLACIFLPLLFISWMISMIVLNCFHEKYVLNSTMQKPYYPFSIKYILRQLKTKIHYRLQMKCYLLKDPDRGLTFEGVFKYSISNSLSSSRSRSSKCWNLWILSGSSWASCLFVRVFVVLTLGWGMSSSRKWNRYRYELCAI